MTSNVACLSVLPGLSVCFAAKGRSSRGVVAEVVAVDDERGGAADLQAADVEVADGRLGGRTELRHRHEQQADSGDA